MKIAILAERMLPGSIPKVTSAEARYLVKLGHDVEIVTIMEGGLHSDSYQFQEFLDGIKIRELSREFRMAKLLDFKLPFFAFLSGYHVLGPVLASHIIKNREYDLIIALNTVTALTAYQVYKRRNIPYVNYHWDPFSYIFTKVYASKLPGLVSSPLFRITSWFDRLIVENSVITISLSEDHATFLRSLTRKRDIEVVYLGCFPVEHLKEKRGDYLLAIDRWDRGNMPHILLDVLAKLEKKIPLIVAGFCSEKWIEESFLQLRDQKGLTSYVKWLGPVSETELEELYSHARAWLHPIEESSLSMPALEAAAHGCPIVMPRGTPLFRNEVNSFFPAEGDVEQYAQYVDRLVGDERLAWSMGCEAWKVAKQNSWESHAEQLCRILNERAQLPIYSK